MRIRCAFFVTATVVGLQSSAWGQQATPAQQATPEAPPQPPTAVVASRAPQPEGRSVFFAPEDRSAGWTLLSSDGSLALCTLPCSYSIADRQGYRLRSPTGAETTFFGYETMNSARATILPPTGNKGAAIITVAVSAVAGAVGAVLFFAGNTQKCGYGMYTDSNGNTAYMTEVDGKCASTAPPPGYTPGSGTDLGATATANQKTGIVLMGLGAAGLVGGGVWFFLSRSSPAIAWGNAATSSSTTESKTGLRVGLTPTGMALQGTW